MDKHKKKAGKSNISHVSNSKSNDTMQEFINNKYKSAKIALPTMMDEYTKERERSGILDNKAVALLTILIALITIYVPIIPFDKIKTIYISGQKNQIIILVIIIMVFISALIITGYEFFWLISTLKLQTYKRVEIDKIVSDAALQCDDEIMERQLCKHYFDLININSEKNDLKAKNLKSCYVQTISIFILMLVSAIGMNII